MVGRRGQVKSAYSPPTVVQDIAEATPENLGQGPAPAQERWTVQAVAPAAGPSFPRSLPDMSGGSYARGSEGTTGMTKTQTVFPRGRLPGPEAKLVHSCVVEGMSQDHEHREGFLVDLKVPCLARLWP